MIDAQVDGLKIIFEDVETDDNGKTKTNSKHRRCSLERFPTFQNLSARNDKV